MKKCILLLVCLYSCVSADIYVCFPFFNELELLEIHLHELYDHVDKFILVESTKTFRGNPKTLYFKKNRQKFTQFQDKIIHIVIENNPHTDGWAADFYQRDQIMRGLQGCKPDDIIIIGDADEILRPTTIPLIVDYLTHQKVPAVKCLLEYYRYFLNTWQQRAPHEVNVVATTYEYLSTTTPNQLRWAQRGDENGFAVILNAGWHFTSMGGIDRFSYKLASFAHAEFDHPEYKTINYILESLRHNGKIVPIDETFPKLIISNLEYYKDHGFIYMGDTL